MRYPGIVLVVAGLLASPASAKPRDIMCNAISKTTDGKFTYSQIPGLSIVKVVSEDRPFTVEGAPEIVGFACARTEIVPIVNDVKVLQAGYSLAIGISRGGAITMIDLRIVDGRVVANTAKAAISESEQRQIDNVVRQMQARVDAAKS